MFPSYPYMWVAWYKGEMESVPYNSGGTWKRQFYDGLGRLIQVHTPYQDWYQGGGGHEAITAYQYDGLGQKLVETVPYTKTGYVFDYDCQETGKACNPYVDPDFSQPHTTYDYDPVGRVTQVTNPDGTTLRTFYNQWRTATVDANNHLLVKRSDAFGRLDLVQEFLGEFEQFDWNLLPPEAYADTSYVYDVRNQTTDIFDDAGNQTQLFYNQLGQKWQMIDPDMGTWSYYYNAVGELTSQYDALLKWACFEYDEMGRMTRKRYRQNGDCNTVGGESINVNYFYDQTENGNHGAGRRTQMTDQSGTASWLYDSRGRVVQELKVVDGIGTYRTRWLYDSADRVIGMNYPGNAQGWVGEPVVSTYNVMGLPMSLYHRPDIEGLQDYEYYVKRTDYDVNARVTGRWLGYSVIEMPIIQTTYRYYPWSVSDPQQRGNSMGRLRQITAGLPAQLTSLQDLRYEYDPVGNVHEIDDYKAGSPQTQEFDYDELNRLTGAVATGGADGEGDYPQEDYTYNQIGNLMSMGTREYAYNDTSHKHAVTDLDSQPTFSYDANGNQTQRLLSDGAYDLSYTADNQLERVRKTANGENMELAGFTYDGDGKRVKKVANGVTTIYLGNYYEQEGSAVTLYYYSGSQRVAMRRSGYPNQNGLFYILTDQLGSTSITADSLGNRVAEVRYKAWGEDRYAFGTTPTTYRYTGQRQEVGLGPDGEPGLYYYNARWYDPYTGRFVQADTVIPGMMNPQALNRYSYVFNNPIGTTDPSGHGGPVQNVYPDDIPEEPNRNPGGRQYSAEEVNALARMIYGEEAQMGRDAMIAAGWTAVNRLIGAPALDDYGNYSKLTLVDVITEDDPAIQYQGYSPDNPLDYRLIAVQILDGSIPDPTGGATYMGNWDPGSTNYDTPVSLGACHPATYNVKVFPHAPGHSGRPLITANFEYSNGSRSADPDCPASPPAEETPQESQPWN